MAASEVCPWISAAVIALALVLVSWLVLAARLGACHSKYPLGWALGWRIHHQAIQGLRGVGAYQNVNIPLFSQFKESKKKKKKRDTANGILYLRLSFDVCIVETSGETDAFQGYLDHIVGSIIVRYVAESSQQV